MEGTDFKKPWMSPGLKRRVTNWDELFPPEKRVNPALYEASKEYLLGADDDPESVRQAVRLTCENLIIAYNLGQRLDYETEQYNEALKKLDDSIEEEEGNGISAEIAAEFSGLIAIYYKKTVDGQNKRSILEEVLESIQPRESEEEVQDSDTGVYPQEIATIDKDDVIFLLGHLQFAFSEAQEHDASAQIQAKIDELMGNSPADKDETI